MSKVPLKDMKLEEIKQCIKEDAIHAAELFLEGCASHKTSGIAILIFQKLQISEMNSIIVHLDWVENAKQKQHFSRIFDGLTKLRDDARLQQTNREVSKDKESVQASSYKEKMILGKALEYYQQLWENWQLATQQLQTNKNRTLRKQLFSQKDQENKQGKTKKKEGKRIIIPVYKDKLDYFYQKQIELVQTASMKKQSLQKTSRDNSRVKQFRNNKQLHIKQCRSPINKQTKFPVLYQKLKRTEESYGTTQYNSIQLFQSSQTPSQGIFQKNKST